MLSKIKEKTYFQKKTFFFMKGSTVFLQVEKSIKIKQISQNCFVSLILLKQTLFQLQLDRFGPSILCVYAILLEN